MEILADHGLVILNSLANLLTFLGTMAFLILLYGQEESAIYEYNALSAFLIKVSLTIISLNGLSNFIHGVFVDQANLLLNLGLAILFCSLSLEKICNTYGILCIGKCKKKRSRKVSIFT
jgi:hypothetical protein